MERVNTKLDRNDFIIETGKVARQADGSVTVQLGGTVVLVTCVSSKKPREGIDFLPLTVEYQERTYAAGKIPGGFFKREGRPTEKAILSARLIDRPIRPLFPKGMVNDIQVVAVVLSSDGENNSDILAVNGASAALSISDIPFDGPVGCVRVGLIDGKFILNPTFQELDSSELDFVVVGHGDKILMMEAGAKELSEEKIEEAIEFARKPISDIIGLQKELAAKCGRKKREDITIRAPREELTREVEKAASARLDEINRMGTKDKREEALEMLTKELMEKFAPKDGTAEEWEVKSAIEKVEKDTVRKYILKDKKRIDQRTFGQIRPIECAVGVLPRTHGSGLFTRGQTQALCVATLGTSADEQMIDALEGETQKSFMLHYNFPPFSVGETSPIRGPGRREIGHGALAEKALRFVMPPKETFPYTVRLVSDILESNGSSSMASVCAGSLSLMDAGVPTKAPVAGIAIGLVSEGNERVLLTDIAGVEDHYGDMDFKVAGTGNGITAIQMDLKIRGLEKDSLNNALRMAKKARLEVLERMNNAISGPKTELSALAPRITNLKVNPEKIKDIIGPGGRMIKKIIKETGVTIDVEDDGSVQVASSDDRAMREAVEIIKGLTAEAEVGKVYTGKITRLMNFGAFCEILPGKEGLIHVSQLSNKFIKDVASEVKVGDVMQVKVIEIDAQNRVNLSRKAVLDEESGAAPPPGDHAQSKDIHKKKRRR